jgi:hypothetical protein
MINYILNNINELSKEEKKELIDLPGLDVDFENI